MPFPQHSTVYSLSGAFPACCIDVYGVHGFTAFWVSTKSSTTSIQPTTHRFVLTHPPDTFFFFVPFSSFPRLKPPDIARFMEEVRYLTC